MFESNVSHPWDYHHNSSENFHYQNDDNAEQLSEHYQNIDHYYNLENVPKAKNFSCEVCNKSFYSRGQYKKHIDEHVECPFPECGLKGCVKIIDQHISHQHMLVNFEALQIDDETWISERKKRFPSAQRAELRRAEQLERIKRGERLGKNSSKFAKKENYKEKSKGTLVEKDQSETDNTRKTSHKKFNKEKKEQNMNAKGFKTIVEKKLEEEDSDSEIKFGISGFKGTKAFYESIGEVSLFGFKSNLCFPENQSKIDISDEEEWNEPISTIEPQKCVLQNALGSLMGAYDSESETECNSESITTQVCAVPDRDKQMDEVVKETKSDVQLKEEEGKGSEGTLIRRKFRPNRNRQNETKQSKSRPEKRSLDSKYKPKKYRRRTLLQKLLEPEIVHERNVILQCIRHIVDNNFFESQTEEPMEESTT